MAHINQLAGRILRKDAEIIIIFRVGRKYYPATEHNTELFETYLHTGNPVYLEQLENEVEI